MLHVTKMLNTVLMKASYGVVCMLQQVWGLLLCKPVRGLLMSHGPDICHAIGASPKVEQAAGIGF